MPDSVPPKVRIAIISPFLDRCHGTERVVVEQLERFAANPAVEIHIYAQQLEGLHGVSQYDASKEEKPFPCIFWHRVPRLPGPHLFAYIWWFFANQLYRWRDTRFRGLYYDLIYSPGINTPDADAIAIHILFNEFYRQVRSQLNFSDLPLTSWPRNLHRRLYYQLAMRLERRVYVRRETQLAAVSQIVADQVAEFFQRSDVFVIPNGVDTERFAPEIRSHRRAAVREQMGLADCMLVVLLIGNDWKKKGLDTLLRSIAQCQDVPLKLMVVGNDDRNAFGTLIQQLGLQRYVEFMGPEDDIVRFYAAADVYAGPSLEDAFGLPPLEAMACGLPVITSANAGVSQIITEGVDGFILLDPHDSATLARLLRDLHDQPDLRRRIGENAARTAQAYSCQRNADETWAFLMSALEKKRSRASGLKSQFANQTESAGRV